MPSSKRPLRTVHNHVTLHLTRGITMTDVDAITQAAQCIMQQDFMGAVSYTHLTLPTILLV